MLANEYYTFFAFDWKIYFAQNSILKSDDFLNVINIMVLDIILNNSTRFNVVSHPSTLY